MRPAIYDATARQNSGGPLSVIGQTGDRSDQPRSSKIDDTEAEIAGLTDRSTHELRLAWRRLYRRRPPLGLSRDLIIRALANKMQECAYGGPSLAMTRLASSTKRPGPSTQSRPIALSTAPGGSRIS